MFSMTFFNWSPSNDNRMISPWIGLYFGATVVLTSLLVWWSRKCMDSVKFDAGDDIKMVSISGHSSMV